MRRNFNYFGIFSLKNYFKIFLENAKGDLKTHQIIMYERTP